MKIKFRLLMTPKSTRLKRKQRYGNIEQKLNKIPLNQYAVKSGFNQRKEKKIKAKELLIAFIFMAMQGKNSFQHWAEHLGLLSGETISKQGIWKRITERFTGFLAMVLLDALRLQLNDTQKQAMKYQWIKKYKRVLLQDSTVIALPAWLHWCYPGNVSRGEKKSQLKIQAIYDILSDRFIYFEITPYTDNDQSKSKDILSIAQQGDLIIRDLGYFVIDSFKKMANEGLAFISRLRFGVTMYDIETGKEINLLKLLKKTGGIDIWISAAMENRNNI